MKYTSFATILLILTSVNAKIEILEDLSDNIVDIQQKFDHERRKGNRRQTKFDQNCFDSIQYLCVQDAEKVIVNEPESQNAFIKFNDKLQDKLSNWNNFNAKRRKQIKKQLNKSLQNKPYLKEFWKCERKLIRRCTGPSDILFEQSEQLFADELVEETVEGDMQDI